MVKWAKVEDTQPYPNTDSLKAMVFAMHIGLLFQSPSMPDLPASIPFVIPARFWHVGMVSAKRAMCRLSGHPAVTDCGDRP